MPIDLHNIQLTEEELKYEKHLSDENTISLGREWISFFVQVAKNTIREKNISIDTNQSHKYTDNKANHKNA